MNDSVAASAGPVLPMPGIAPAPVALLRWRMTPDPCSTIRRAAARAVMKFDLSPVTTARSRSSAARMPAATSSRLLALGRFGLSEMGRRGAAGTHR